MVTQKRAAKDHWHHDNDKLGQIRVSGGKKE